MASFRRSDGAGPPRDRGQDPGDLALSGSTPLPPPIPLAAAAPDTPPAGVPAPVGAERTPPQGARSPSTISQQRPRQQPYAPQRIPLALAITPPEPLPLARVTGQPQSTSSGRVPPELAVTPAAPLPPPPRSTAPAPPGVQGQPQVPLQPAGPGRVPPELAVTPAEPLPLPRLAARPAGPSNRPPPPAAFVVELPPAGDLNFFDAPRVVGWAVATGYSGCLWLAPSMASGQSPNPLTEDAAPHRELYLENGALIGAFSTLPGDALADYLLPLWSRPQQNRAREVVAEIAPSRLRDQLAALVDAKLLKRASATAHLASYVNALCTRALVPGPGRYRVLPRALTSNERIEPPLPLRRLLVEGLRKGASLEFLQLRLGPPETFLRPTAVIGATEGGAALLDVGLSPAEEIALSCFNGRFSLIDIASRAKLGEHAVYVLAYALLCLGAAAVPRLTPRPMPKPQRPQVTTDGLLPGVVPRPPAAPAAGDELGDKKPPAGDPEAAIRRVQQKFRHVEEGDYFAVLELTSAAGIADVLRSYQALRAEFLPAALPYRCRSSMDRELRQIARALDEARLVLGSEASRRTYLQSLAPLPTGAGS